LTAAGRGILYRRPRPSFRCRSHGRPPRQSCAVRHDPPEARAAARRAYGRARAAGGLAPVVVDRLWSETLMAIDGQPAPAASEMLEDRARWPK